MKKSTNQGDAGTKLSADGQTLMTGADGADGGPTDEVLIGRCRGGNMAAFGQLIERYQDRLFNAVLRVVGNRDDALELTQDAFVRALQGLRRFRSQSSFYTWLFRIGINLGINLRRRQQRMRVSSYDSVTEDQSGQAAGLAQRADPDSPQPVRQAEIKEEHGRVLAALEELAPEARAIVVLRDIEQLNYAQIGQVLEVPMGTVKSRLARARMSLREKLKTTAGKMID